MDILKLKLIPSERNPDPQAIFDLRQDLNQNVGAAELEEVSGEPGQKGSTILEIATLSVSILGAPAMVALTEVIKSYFDRDRFVEMIVTGPKGTAILRLPQSAKLSAEEIRAHLKTTLSASK